MYVPYASGSPTVTAATRSASLDTKRSYTGRVTMAREQAEHFCPWNPKADTATPSTAASTSASSSTMMASLPPISATTRLSQR